MKPETHVLAYWSALRPLNKKGGHWARPYPSIPTLEFQTPGMMPALHNIHQPL